MHLTLSTLQHSLFVAIHWIIGITAFHPDLMILNGSRLLFHPKISCVRKTGLQMQKARLIIGNWIIGVSIFHTY